MLATLFFKYVLAVLFGVGIDDGYATLYGTPDDPQSGVVLACGGAIIPQDQPLCAHRWLPCGTVITVVNDSQGGLGRCEVADRGPYGIDPPTKRWRGILDMTPGAARKAKLSGKDFVRIIYQLPPPSSRTYDDRRFLVAKPLKELRRRGPAM
jgi:rare lipoprotein A (peptidoglycan hydrolase)